VRLALAAIVALLASSVDARTIHSETSLYQNILVTEEGSVRCMQFTVRKDQRNQSCIDQRRPKHLVFPYARMMMASLLLNPMPTNVLVVGLGGGTLPTALSELYPNASIDVVEIDPAVVVVAKRYFGFKPTDNMRVFEQDARVWAKRAESGSKRYDLIMLDAFNGDYIPEHLMTREYLAETRALLTNDGVLASNTFAISRLYHNESVTYADVFGPFFNLRSDDTANRVIIASRAALPDTEKRVANAKALVESLQPYGVPIEDYASTMRTSADWDVTARILTDQYSPANLLKAQP
jgi:spermidine synthase